MPRGGGGRNRSSFTKMSSSIKNSSGSSSSSSSFTTGGNSSPNCNGNGHGGSSSFRCRSFLLGVIIASITWIASMYLYWNLSATTEGSSIFSDASGRSSHRVTTAYIPLVELSRRAHLFKNFQKTIKEAPSSGVWKLKFKQLVEDGTMFKKPSAVLGKERRTDLKSKVINTGDHDQDQDNNLGSSVFSDSIGLVKTIEERKLKQEGYKVHAFNALISSRLDFNRSIPDTRHDRCSSIEYSSPLPKASVIICFYNEEFHVLIRSIKSVLDRAATNSANLHEVLVVDDYSDLEDLHFHVQTYIEEHFPHGKVKLIKTPRREGLIRARIFAAGKATGDVLVFLDSHIEANINWLDPLLARIKDDPTTIVTPIIDIISPDTFVYSSSPLVRGGFNWGLHFKWDNVPKELLTHSEDFIKPIVSATMAGGLFAMDREYFMKLGEYDEGMDIWGGENIEMSFRVWMCGGKIEIIPCSRIGHVFRRRRPYGAPNGEDTILKNSVRVAEVWMDEFKEKFYAARPSARSLPYGYGNIQPRVQLRKKLGCKPFKWYLDNIYPDILREDAGLQQSKIGKNPATNNNSQSQSSRSRRNFIARFQINLLNTKLCVETSKAVTTKNSGLQLGTCQAWNKKQRWSETDKHELILAELLCLDAAGDGGSKLRLGKCHELLGSQEWRRSGEKSTAIYNVGAGQCLAATAEAELVNNLADHDNNDNNNSTLLTNIVINKNKAHSQPKTFVVGSKLTMDLCSETNPAMIFDLINYQPML